MLLRFLGTGSSQGIPVIGSQHPVCLSENRKDKRLRSSAIVTTENERKILIDCGPDFRQQMLINGEGSIDAVLLTHEHNDHVMGMDDLRPIIFSNGKDMDVYCMPRVAEEIKKRFAYAFQKDPYPGAPAFKLHEVKGDFSVFDTPITPIKVNHYKIQILGYRFKDLAYITDCSSIEQEEKEKMRKLDYLIINCLRKEPPHHAHLVLPQVIDLVEELKPKETYLTHISHLLGFHDEVEKELPANMHLAFDGLEIRF